MKFEPGMKISDFLYNRQTYQSYKIFTRIQVPCDLEIATQTLTTSNYMKI